MRSISRSRTTNPFFMSDDNKQKRYDRQIRIWGAEGQSRLENSRIALLNCSPTGSETLKNLVLGGIASFTIVDGEQVTARDLGNNFLVLPTSLGSSRAQVVTQLLKELNDSVKGSFVEDTPANVLESNPQFFDDFDLVIATQMPESQLVTLDNLCRNKKLKLLIARSYGLMGYMRISVVEHTVIESKPDTQVDDLRITCPWPELEAYAASFDLASLDDTHHKHVPYGLLLLQAASRWRQDHGGAVPSNSAERAEFKKQLNGMRRQGSLGVAADEENFDEAVKAAFHAWTQPSIPSEVRLLLEDEATDLSPSSPDFWVLVAALKAFVAQEGNGMLPLDGSIPDMHATTDSYLQLQRVYRERAEKDAAAVEGHVQRLLVGLGRSQESIPSSAVRQFCKHARNLRLCRYRPLREETGQETSKGSTLAALLGEEGTAANASLYVLLRACDRFQQQHGRVPGQEDSDVEEDVPLLKSAAQQILGEMGAAGASVQDDYVAEMARLGGAELHVVASIMGGMAAQEAIKLVTQQFVPFSGTLIYNAVNSTTSVFEL